MPVRCAQSKVCLAAALFLVGFFAACSWEKDSKNEAAVTSLRSFLFCDNFREEALFILISFLGIRLVWNFSYQSYMPVRCAQSKVCLAAAWAEISAHSATLLVAWFRVGALTEFNKSHGLTQAKAMKSSPLLGPFCGSEFWGLSLL